MKLKLQHTFLLIVFVLLGNALIAQKYVDGKQRGAIRVKMHAMLQANLKSIKTTRKGVETGIVTFDAVSQQVAAYNMKRVFRYSPKFEERHQQAGLHLWYEIEFDENLNPEEVARQYNQLPEVTSATIIPEVTLIGGDIEPQISSSEAVAAFNDPMLAKQWHYDNDGSQSWAEQGADINLSKAWELETGSSDVIVAIIDGGVEADHPDLKDAMWINETELNGIEGIDDDGNGYVDDVYGYNFAKKNGSITTHYHGTHVAGTVGAVSNNGEGVSGIAGGDGVNPGVRLMSCQVFTEDGGAGGYAEAIVYAADMGAVIGQNSWGWSTDGAYDPAVLEAIDYFNANAGSYAGSPMKGGVSIFAAGNLGYELDIYPAAYEPCIAVASIGPDFKKAPYSVYADWVDVSAPGGNVNLDKEAQVLSTYGDGGYAWLQGTSMACPHVSGIAALVVSKFKASDFTADKLKQHLLTSVHDVEPYQVESVKGKMGNGYIDAWMALQSGDPSIAPDPVSGFSVQTSQDFATFIWTVPADGDDEKAVSYNLYWSKEPFTEANLQSAGSTVVNKFFANVGEELNYSIDKLDAQTNYYFAIKAFDRWGNASELSEVVMVATNNGPEIVLGDEVAFTIDVKTNAAASEVYSFQNVGEGVLNWRAHIGLDSLSLAPFAENTVSYPNFISAPVLTGVGSDNVLVDGIVATPNYASIDERMRYVEYSTNATKIIGENDTTITNSAATWYQVTEPEGFNLTHMWLNLKVNPETGPIVVEVWKGSVLRDAELLSAQNYKTKTAAWTSHYVQLEEQIHFQQGDVYWVVVHIPSGNLYPLGIAEEMSEEYSERCFMSFNGGQSWRSLAAEINKDTYVWSWVMQSTMNDLGDYITFTPDEGVLTSGSTQELALDIDASNLIDGYYEDNVVIMSNDPKNPVVRGKVKFDVTGHDPKLNSAKTVDFGNVFVGATKTIDVQIANEGLRGYQLPTNGYTSSNPDVFITDEIVSGETIPALSEGWVRITFAPNAEGIFNSTISLTNNQGYSHSFTVHGVSVLPANIIVADNESGTSEVTIAGDLTVGDAIANRTFTITNSGNYPLHYKVPKFAPDYEVEGLVKPINNFGYTYDYALKAETPDPVEHNWEDIISTGTHIVEELRGPKFAVQTDIGFSFPFRDRFYNKVWVNEQGALIFGEEGDKNLDWVSGSELNPTWLRDYDMVTAVMMQASFRDNSQICYRREDGMFRAQYKNVVYGNTVGVDMQIVLHANGDVDILFKKSAYNSSYLIAMVDKDNSDIAFISNSQYIVPLAGGIKSMNSYNEFFHFYHPGENMIMDVTNPSGTVQPGESVSLEVSFNTESVLQDTVYERLAIVSNDPDSPVTKYTVNANFVAGGTPALTAEETSIDFGDVFKTDVVEYITKLSNSGTAEITITDIQFQNNGMYSTSKAAELPLVVKARQSVNIPVMIHTGVQTDVAAGQLNDIMIVTDENGATYEINLTGNVVENPLISVTPVEGITQTLNAGETIDRQFTIVNDGAGELEYAFVPNLWCYLKSTEGAAVADFKEFDYVFDEGDGKQYIDITESAAHTNLESKFLDDFIPYFTLPLKNEYAYFGQKYSTLYISCMGWVSFIEPDITDFSYRPLHIPIVDKMPGVIAPMAAFHLPYYYSQRQKQGIYYQEESDKVIVSWEDFYPVAGGRIEYSFQVVIHSTGQIDFNYKDLERPSIAAVIGVENPNEEDGLLIWRDYMPTMPNNSETLSYSIFPVEKKRIAANSSQVIDLTLDATRVNDGVYTKDFRIINNTVGSQEVNLPVELTVVGEPELGVQGNDAGMVWYVAGEAYTSNFTIRNTGTKTVYLDHALLEQHPELQIDYTYAEVLDSRGNVLVPAGVVPILDFVGQEAYVEVWGRFGPVPYLVGDGTKLAPGDEWNLRMTYTPAAPSLATSVLRLIDADMAEAFSCPLSIESKMPPAITVSDDVVTVNADDESLVTSRDLVIGNINGSGTLEWNIDLIFNRGQQAEATTASAQLKATNSSEQLQKGEATQAEVSLKAAAATYNRTLSYTDATAKNNNIGFGAGLAFVSGTRFEAPESGYLLSHIETFYIRESVLNGVISVEIRAGGSSIVDAIPVGKGHLNLAFDNADSDVGEFVTIELDDPVYIYPGEDFYVIINYPLGISKPQGVVYTDFDQIVPNRYFFNYQNNWFDMNTQQGFQDMVFMVRAHELSYEEKTWVSIAPGQMNGTTAVGQESSIQLNFVAANAQEIRNNAQLKISSNDPINNELVVDVNLLMNEAPYAELISGSQKVEETQIATLTFKITDNEGDAVSNELVTDIDWISYQDNSNEVVLTATPGYDAQGVHRIEVVSTDEHGLQRSTPFDIQVINVNRTPEFAVALKDTTVMWEHGDFEIDFSEVITDIDNDPMIYSITVDNEDVLELLYNDGRAILKPVMIGATNVTLTGKDVHGAQVQGSYTITVIHRTGVDDNAIAGLEIYPNPAVDVLNITWFDNAAEANLRLTNATGAVVLEQQAAGTSSQLNISHLSKGVYMLEMRVGEQVNVQKVVKN
ncbi:S8 family serine peptidase [Carboxylicivirga mesophila]|uniref:S8 family serine peptidase n=1 Tax=Carboxylicivirga mesophila TaxID=1166478 RepID=A0ABS5KEK3_9BACT|nr:S8 family serine peptidase [Carboxylicivirga mesophila]MBS2213478.1 S8 family serine peptidase [Carboxylicivirga mesophila]